MVATIVAGALTAISTTAVEAADLFTLTGGDPTTTFVLPANPTVNYVYDGAFYIQNITVTIGGVTTMEGITFLEYGIFEDDYGLYDLDGVTNVYSGPLSNPTFVLGSYPGFNFITGQYDTLTITAVPEPGTWALFLTGFGLLGFMMRGSRWKRAAAVA